jgi:hypothetical protein
MAARMETPIRPRLSIVIPTHDTRELTLACLGSLYRSLPEGSEVILVDDASRDATAEEVRARFPEAVVLRNEEPAGFTRAANRGLARAAGEVLLLLNSDTEVEPGGLARLAGIFAEDPKLGIVGAALHYPDGTPQWSGGGAPTKTWLFALASGLPALLARLPFYRRVKPVEPARPERVDWVTGAALAVRRAVWEEAGPLDEGFRFYAQDLDFCLRVRRAGWRAAVRPELRVLHHHGATIGRDPNAGRHQHPELLWSDLLRWARKHHGEPWARSAERWLRCGARLRLLGRGLAGPFVPAAERERWRAETRTFRHALAAVRASR